MTLWFGIVKVYYILFDIGIDSDLTLLLAYYVSTQSPAVF